MPHRASLQPIELPYAPHLGHIGDKVIRIFFLPVGILVTRDGEGGGGREGVVGRTEDFGAVDNVSEAGIAR